MPWQAHLYIGVPLSNMSQVRGLYQELGADVSTVSDQDLSFNESGNNFGMPVRTIMAMKKKHKVSPYAIIDSEGSDGLPETGGEKSNTFALFGFPLTARYYPAILDVGNAHGRPDPFVINIVEVSKILEQVREWWPAAQFMVMDHFH